MKSPTGNKVDAETANTTVSIDEGVPANTVVYTPVSADPARGTITYALTGADAKLCTINSSTGVVTINDVPEFVNKSRYKINIVSTDSNNVSTAQSVNIDINPIDLDVNDLPPPPLTEAYSAYIVKNSLDNDKKNKLANDAEPKTLKPKK